MRNRTDATLPPLRRIVTRGAGSSVLECGHVVNTPHHTKTLRVRCATCLPLVERQRYIKLKRTRGRNRCKKCGGIAQPMHVCPYKFDMDNDAATKCNCCDDCQYECAREV